MAKGKYSPYPGDIVDARLEPGEFVLNRNAVDYIGEENLKQINDEVAPRFAQSGGQIRYDDDVEFDEESPTMMNEGGAIWDKLQADRKFNQEQYNNPSIMFKDNSLSARMKRKEEADDVALRQATNARIGQYHKEVKDLEQKSKLRQLQLENAFHGPKPLQLRREKGIPIDLQKVEVPMGDKFNTDEFNSMMSVTKTMNDFFTRQGMNDSQGRNPMDEDYGQIKGLDPKTWKMPTDGRRLTPAEQLMAQMNQKRNKDYNTHIDENNPDIAQVYKDNPLMELERQNRARNLQKWSDKRTQKIKDDVALEYSPYALHNADIREELIGDPNDPSDDIGSSFADAQKRSDERSELYRQNQEIAMMNPGHRPKKPIDPKTGKPYETWESYVGRMEALDKELKEGRTPLTIKKDNSEFKTNMQPIIAGIEKRTGKRSLMNKFSDFTEGFARGKHGTLDDKYDYQSGGSVQHYLLGDLVKQGQQSWEQFKPQLEAGMDKLGQTADSIKQKAMDRYGGGFRKAQNVAGERYLGETLEGFGDMDRDQQIAMSKELRDTGGVKHIMSDEEKSQMWGQGLQEAGSQLGQDVVAGAKAIPGLAGKAALVAGAGTLGAGVVGGKYLWDKGKQIYNEGFDKDVEGGLLKDAAHHLTKGAADNYGDVWSGKEKGSLMQRGKKGLGMLGMMLQDASKAQGFKGADWEESGFRLTQTGPKKQGERPDIKVKSEEEDIIEDIDLTESNAEMDEMMNEAFGGPKPKLGVDIPASTPLGTSKTDVELPSGNVIQGTESLSEDYKDNTGAAGTIPSIAVEPALSEDTGSESQDAINNTLNLSRRPNTVERSSQGHVMVNQQGGMIGFPSEASLEGFIQQSWRNMR